MAKNQTSKQKVPYVRPTYPVPSRFRISDGITCLRCSTMNQGDAFFCIRCGLELWRKNRK